jgi:hypothetical protein
MKILPSLFALLACLLVIPIHAENIVFPAVAGVVDITKPPYNADNTGIKDCAAAGIIKQAIPISALYCVGAAAVQDAFTKAAAGPDLSVSMMGTRAVIRYSPPAMATIATIRIVNAQGRNMIAARAAPHPHEFAFNRNALPAGRYLCVLKARMYERIAPLAISK